MFPAQSVLLLFEITYASSQIENERGKRKDERVAGMFYREEVVNPWIY